MKRTLSLPLSLAAAAAFGLAPLTAAPLDRSQVAADAKWLLHLDFEALLKSQLGARLEKMIVAEAGEDLKEANLDLSAILKGTKSVMAYGTDFNSGKDGKGVLVWQGAKEIEQLVSGLLVQQAEATKAGQGNVKLVRDGAHPIHAFGEDMHVMAWPEGGLILGRAVDQIDEAIKVLEKKAPSLKDKPIFADYAPLPGGFFFLALADGFNQAADVPPQASVLKLTDGGRLALGEADGKLRLQLTLKAQSDEITQQIQQVVQGLLAVATLSQSQQPELQELIRGAKVNSEKKRVTLDLAIPIEAALKQLDEHHGDGKQGAKEAATDGAR
jgi:hypothetical protein